MRFWLVFFSCLFFSACSPNTMEDYHEEGESIVYSVTQLLQTIHTREQLIAAVPRLQTHFDRLVDVMIAAETLNRKKLDLKDNDTEIAVNHELSDLLRIEINRLYQMEGGRALIEKSQENALHRLKEWFKTNKPEMSLEAD